MTDNEISIQIEIDKNMLQQGLVYDYHPVRLNKNLTLCDSTIINEKNEMKHKSLFSGRRKLESV